MPLVRSPGIPFKLNTAPAILTNKAVQPVCILRGEPYSKTKCLHHYLLVLTLIALKAVSVSVIPHVSSENDALAYCTSIVKIT